jgi:hypothetical protein
MTASTTVLTQGAVIGYIYAPIFALFIYLIFKMIAHFKW